jgi:transposase
VVPAADGEHREVYNALRWPVRTGAPWRYLPTNFPPWEAVYQQTQRWFAAGVFEAVVHDLRVLLRRLQDRPDTSVSTPSSRSSFTYRCGIRVTLPESPSTK